MLNNTEFMKIASPENTRNAMPLDAERVAPLRHPAIFKEHENGGHNGFGAYQSFGQTPASRLGHAALGPVQIWPGGEWENRMYGDGNPLAFQINSFKELMMGADKRAMANENVVTPEDARKIKNRFNHMLFQFNSLMRDEKNIAETMTHEIAAMVKKEFFPFLLLTHSGERCYSKPRGYAGDFYTIETIYQNTPRGIGRLGPVLDACFLDLPVSWAVRNRRSLLSNEITKTIQKKNGEKTKIMSIACGPSREVTDAFEMMEDNKKTSLHATLLDFDSQALSFVDQIISDMKLKKQVAFLNENIIDLISGKKSIKLEKQDLIYSVGLIDYFKDEMVIQLLNYIHDSLSPNGRVILGNFHPANPNRAFMEHVLEWRLIHRNEEDMNRLFRASKFKKPCSNIVFENEKINLFAECER